MRLIDPEDRSVSAVDLLARRCDQCDQPVVADLTGQIDWPILRGELRSIYCGRQFARPLSYVPESGIDCCPSDEIISQWEVR